MPRFIYKATNSSGQKQEGIMEAESANLVIRELQAQGLLPIEIKEKGKTEISISSGYVLAFTQQLASLLSGGMPLEACLVVLEELTRDRQMRMVISELKDSIRRGEKFSISLSLHPRVFSRFYVSMIEVGEASGVLELTLKRLADFAAKEEELRAHIKSVLTYPLVMTLVGGLAMIIILTFVVPRFVLVFKAMGQSLPLPTIALINLSGLIVHWWWLILGLIAGSFLSIRWGLRNKGMRSAFDRLKLRLPLLGSLIGMMVAHRFSANLATLLKGGVTLLDSLFMAKDAVGNLMVAEAIEGVAQRLKQGERLAPLLKQACVLPDLVVHMVACGEQSGNLEEMLEKAAEHYEIRMRYKLRSLVSLIEPILILVMGVIVALIVAAILLPIFAMSELPF